MSIQRTAESALHALGELYQVVETSSQQQGQLTMNDSENLVQALSNLSQLIDHINQTDMCAHPGGITSNLASQRWNRAQMRTLAPPSFSDYDEHRMIGPLPHRGQPYGECIVYHPIRIRTTGAGIPTVHDFDRKKRMHRKDHHHHKRSLHPHHWKKMGKKSSSSSSESSTSSSGTSERKSKQPPMSGRNRRRRQQGPMSQTRARRPRSGRRSTTSSSSSSSTSAPRRSRSRRSRSNRKNSERSRFAQRHNRGPCRHSRKRRSAGSKNKQYRGHQVASRPMSSAAALTSTSNPRLFSSATFIPASPLPAPPTVSIRHPSSSPMPIQQQSATVYRSQVSSPNPTIDQMAPYQQAPPSTATSSVSQQQQRIPGFLSNHPLPRLPNLSTALSSSLATPTTVLASRSENCPECRAITRLLQWTSLKCDDAAGVRRGVFLAGANSDQLLEGLQSPMDDSSLAWQELEDCLGDHE